MTTLEWTNSKPPKIPLYSNVLNPSHENSCPCHFNKKFLMKKWFLNLWGNCLQNNGFSLEGVLPTIRKEPSKFLVNYKKIFLWWLTRGRCNTRSNNGFDTRKLNWVRMELVQVILSGQNLKGTIFNNILTMAGMH